MNPSTFHSPFIIAAQHVCCANVLVSHKLPCLGFIEFYSKFSCHSYLSVAIGNLISVLCGHSVLTGLSKLFREHSLCHLFGECRLVTCYGSTAFYTTIDIRPSDWAHLSWTDSSQCNLSWTFLVYLFYNIGKGIYSGLE